MPNWCSTTWKVTGGDRATLMRFWMDMSRATGAYGGLPKEVRTYILEGKECLVAEDWFGILFLGAGYSMEETERFQTRGYDLSVEWDERRSGDGDDVIRITCEMAWEPEIDGFRKMMDEKYPGLRAECFAEEPGQEIYINTDVRGDLFPERYLIDYSDGDDGDMIYCESGGECAIEAGKITGTAYANAADAMENAERDWGKTHEGNEDAYLYVHEFTDC